ncbi:hypothetical protein TNCV_4306991 [Trichonephila clavipes]|nr:hypothetical protein TNCV_4306991 [Trichonephila clavipes]
MVEQVYRPPPRSERYDSYSVLATVEHRRDSLPSQRVKASQEHKSVRLLHNHRKEHIHTNNVARIGFRPFTTFQTSSAIKGNHSETTGRRLLRRLTLTPHHRQRRLNIYQPRAAGLR